MISEWTNKRITENEVVLKSLKKRVEEIEKDLKIVYSLELYHFLKYNFSRADPSREELVQRKMSVKSYDLLLESFFEHLTTIENVQIAWHVCTNYLDLDPDTENLALELHANFPDKAKELVEAVNKCLRHIKKHGAKVEDILVTLKDRCNRKEGIIKDHSSKLLLIQEEIRHFESLSEASIREYKKKVNKTKNEAERALICLNILYQEDRRKRIIDQLKRSLSELEEKLVAEEERINQLSSS